MDIQQVQQEMDLISLVHPNRGASTQICVSCHERSGEVEEEAKGDEEEEHIVVVVMEVNEKVNEEDEMMEGKKEE